jgi:hypothetical protein
MQGATKSTIPESTFSELDRLYEELHKENARFQETISRLESTGHKLKDTSTPENDTGNKMASERVSGRITDLHYAIIAYRVYNNKLLELAEKLEQII